MSEPGVLEGLDAEIRARELELDTLRRARDIIAGRSFVPETKVCPLCEKDLPAASFTKNTSARDGLSSYCSQCHVAKYGEAKAERRKVRDATAKLDRGALVGLPEPPPREERPAPVEQKSARVKVRPEALARASARSTEEVESCRDEDCSRAAVHPAHILMG